MALNNFNPSNDDDDDDINNGIPIGGFPGMTPPQGERAHQSFDPLDILINYNEKFKTATPIMYRDVITRQMLSCLIGKFKSNALIVGPAGVGKTKIVEDIARRIANDDPLIPDRLKGYTIYELPISSIIAGSCYVGDTEKKAKSVIDFATDPENKVILFIDEIHLLIGGDQSYDKIAQMLKPAMARDDIKIIGATTLQESKTLFDDPAFSRRFSKIIVDELSQEQTEEILKQMAVDMFNHYDNKIVINDSVIHEIVQVSDEYKTAGQHRPDSAITLLDRSMADAYVQRKKLEEDAKTDPNLKAALTATPTIILSKSQMRKTAKKLATGNNEQHEINYDKLREELSHVKGQDDIIEYVVDCLERDGLNLYPRTKPLTLLFAGNSGVGKTEIAKIIANELTGTKPIILNMTEYHSSASINRIIGSPAGYIGSDSKAELPFDILESNPYQVILLDEFEKADSSVKRLFMSAFDEGNIKTAKGAVVDFSKSIIIATTNAGHTTKSETIGFATSAGTATASIVDLSGYFDVELLNRFTSIQNFHPITKSLFADITKDNYERMVSAIKSAHSSYGFLPDTLSDKELDTLVENNYVKEFGARPVRRMLEKYIEDAVLASKKATC